MFERLLQVTIVALVNAISEKVIKPLLSSIAKAIAKRAEKSKRKKESKKKVEEHKNAKTKADKQSTFNQLP